MKENSRIALLVEGYPRYGFQTYSKIISAGSNGMCISRLHPEYVAEKYDLQKVKCYWLSGQKEKDVISPKSMHQIIKLMKTELRGRSGNLIMLDGLEYLLLFNDMGKVMAGLEEVDRLLQEADARMIIPVDPLTLEQKDVARLWEAFPRYTAEEMLSNYSIGQPQHISEVVPGSADQEIADLLGSRESHAMP